MPIDRVRKKLCDNFGGSLEGDGVLGGLRHSGRLHHICADNSDLKTIVLLLCWIRRAKACFRLQIVYPQLLSQFDEVLDELQRKKGHEIQMLQECLLFPSEVPLTVPLWRCYDVPKKFKIRPP